MRNIADGDQNSDNFQSLDISSDIERIEPHYFAIGEVSDVYRCALKSQTQQIVAVKALRGIICDKRIRKAFEQKVVRLVEQWQGMSHPNVMPCLGLCGNFGPMPALVFPMCRNGSIMDYTRVQGSSAIDKLNLLVQVANGLIYLHSHDFVHADIRGANILIDNDGLPLVMDGGLSQIITRGDFTVAGVCGPCRWMAPEALDPPDEIYDNGGSPFTLESDIYSLGMTILEVMTGKVPFHHRRYDTVVMFDVVRGVKPPRPHPDVADDVWRILEACWETDPKKRPTVSLVEAWLEIARLVVGT